MHRRGFLKQYKSPYQGIQQSGHAVAVIDSRTPLKDLRAIYGSALAEGFPDSETAEAVLTSFGLETVEELVAEYECC